MPGIGDTAPGCRHNIVYAKIVPCYPANSLRNLFNNKWACRTGSGIRYPQHVFKTIRIANARFVLWPGDTNTGFVFIFVLITAPATSFLHNSFTELPTPQS